MRRILVWAIGLLVISGGMDPEASWWIDPVKYHVSAHGQTSCQDCHGSIQTLELHPDPALVDKKISDFFDPEGCRACHEEVFEELEGESAHGGKQNVDPEAHRICIQCHDPHVETARSAKKIDPVKPLKEQCGVCHENRPELPPLSGQDRTCMACHQEPSTEDTPDSERVARLCFHCHGNAASAAQEITSGRLPLVEEDAFGKTPHGKSACTVCHHQAARYGHATQQRAQCSGCHLRHSEKTARDAHMRVSCEACHLEGVQPVRQMESGRILAKPSAGPGEISRVHHMIPLDKGEEGCRRCHGPGNSLGASAMLLPVKGILCMPCHTAAFSLADTVSIVSLVVFFGGMVLVFSYWLTGTIPGKPEAGALSKFFHLAGSVLGTIFSTRIFPVLKALFLDALLQRRLFRQSRARWIIHFFIFFPLVIRFLYGAAALAGSVWKPEWPLVWEMLDKNHPATALVFDLTGISIIIGACLAIGRGMARRSQEPAGFPGQDRAALGMIFGIVLVGFLLEGMRIAMTGYPPGSAYAVLGYGIGALFHGFTGLSGVYGYVWYLHAVLTGAFIAYIPFSRMFHIIMAPVVIAAHAAEGVHKDHRP